MNTCSPVHPAPLIKWFLLFLILLLFLVLAPSVYGTIVDDEVFWTAAESPYLITETVVVLEGGHLHIGPGVEVRFGEFPAGTPGTMRVHAGGMLTIGGTAESPVLLTSNWDLPDAGDWGYLSIEMGAAAVIEHAVLEHGGGWMGNAALRVLAVDAMIRDTEIRDCAAGGIDLYTPGNASSLTRVSVRRCAGAAIRQRTPEMTPSFLDLQVSDNLWDGIVVTGAEVTQALEWSLIGVPYIVEGWIDLAQDGSLSIGPGVSVQFKDILTALQSRIQVGEGASLTALGTAEEPVVFSSAFLSPEAGDWVGIHVLSGGTAQLSHCEIAHAGNTGLAGLSLTGSGSTVADCTIRDALADGLVIAGAGADPVVGPLTVARCGGAPVRLKGADVTPALVDAMILTENGLGDAIRVDAEATLATITEDVEWNVTTAPYALAGSLVVENGATFTLDPGVTLEMAPVPYGLQSTVDLRDGAHLAANGSAGVPIRFVSGRGAPAAGDWGFVRIESDASGQLSHVLLSDGGDLGNACLIIASPDVHVVDLEIVNALAEGIRVMETAVGSSLEGVRIHGCGGWPIWLDSPNLPISMNGLWLHDNVAGDAVCIDATSGPLLADTAWPETGAAYAVYGVAEVGAGATLSILPGARVGMARVGTAFASGIRVLDGGRLEAVGQEAARIVMTSARSTPFPGDWQGVYVDPGGAALLRHCDVSYGGRGDTGMIDAAGESQFDRCILRNSFREALVVRDDLKPFLLANTILDNATYGIRNLTPETVVNAVGTWWGDPSGPYHPTLNVYGQGDRVSDGVLFSPPASAELIGPVMRVRQEALSVHANETSATVQVENTGGAGLEWTASIVSGGSWLSVAPSIGTGSGAAVLSCEANTHTNQRLGVVRMAALNGLGGPVNVLVTQYGTAGVGYCHAADSDADFQVSLRELLRVIQFLSVGGYHCAEGTEDGFAPGEGAKECAGHSSDYLPQDWRLNLQEVLRLVQLYNVGCYHIDSTGEDGFQPGTFEKVVDGS
jgi:hypothetical protein